MFVKLKHIRWLEGRDRRVEIGHVQEQPRKDDVIFVCEIRWNSRGKFEKKKRKQKRKNKISQRKTWTWKKPEFEKIISDKKLQKLSFV